MTTPYTSEILYHFVGGSSPHDDDQNFDTLCKVLASQEIRHRHVASGDSIAIEINYERHMVNGELIVQSIVCLCDIPFDMLGYTHTQKYGRFGVGVDKLCFARQGGRPVIYMPFDTEPGAGVGNYLGTEILNAHHALNEHFSDDIPETHTRHVGQYPATQADTASLAADLLSRDVLAFLKYYNPRLLDTDPHNYYMEREWRKFGSFGLHSSLRNVVVARGYRDKLLCAFPSLRAQILEC